MKWSYVTEWCALVCLSGYYITNRCAHVYVSGPCCTMWCAPVCVRTCCVTIIATVWVRKYYITIMCEPMIESGDPLLLGGEFLFAWWDHMLVTTDRYHLACATSSITTLTEEASQTTVILQYKLLAAIWSAVCSVIQQS